MGHKQHIRTCKTILSHTYMLISYTLAKKSSQSSMHFISFWQSLLLPLFPLFLPLSSYRVRLPLLIFFSHCLKKNGNFCCSGDASMVSSSPQPLTWLGANDDGVAGRGGSNSNRGGVDQLHVPSPGCGMNHHSQQLSPSGAHDDEGRDTQRMIGACVIFVSVVVGLISFILVYDADSNGTSTSIAPLIFTIACIPAAVSTMYKEKVLMEFSQPVDPQFFGFVLSSLQTVLLVILTPLAYSAQGRTFIPDDTGSNLVDGYKCIFYGVYTSSITAGVYAEEAYCQFSVFIIVGYVLSTLLLSLAIEKLVKLDGSQYIHQGQIAGIVLAAFALQIYDTHQSSEGIGSDIIFLVSIVISITGLELHNMIPQKKMVYETTYPEPEDLYGSF
uniref:Uncharacterized protein n=1 Tax=Corethron hystrix TaxID=216773 RepID=A0A7S1FT59_9STRA|mmetsp:Transcript_26702/g.61448  ORF Transcript_26702/g.61448 Transcript_26702/m.61448 type:complete len:386 (+) Transcript_26702:87-1244(+)